MELQELIGKRKLSGVTNDNKPLESIWNKEELYDASILSFVLDGVTYTACEDNNDGYRSSMREVFIDKFICENTFEPIEVLGVYRDKSVGSYDSCDILDLYGMNGKIILSVGTDHSDDYYPSFVSVFYPENIPQS